MSGDWYTNVSSVADKVAFLAKSGLHTIQDSLSELTANVDASATPSIFYSCPPPPSPTSYWDNISQWLVDNRYAVVAVTGATGIGAYMVHKRHEKKHRKRRAARTGNASRKEGESFVEVRETRANISKVLIITNYTSNEISKNVALDLERRGFIVFCACQMLSEKLAIENEGHADIRPLLIKKGEPPFAAVEQFGSYLSIPAPAYHGGHTLHFAGLILGPSKNVTTGPLEILDADQISRAIELGISWPTSMLQYFLPLLREHSGRVLFLNEWIIPSLHTPFYTPAVMTAHSIQALAQTVAREVPSIFTIHMKLGTFDLAHHHGPRNSTRADVLGWSPSVRAAYSSSYRNCTGRPVTARVRGSPLKELHHAVFDALTDARPSTHVSVGAGVRMYQFIADVLPEFVLRHLLGVGIATGEDDWEVVEQ